MMAWSAFGSFTNNPDGAKMMASLGYPHYLNNFLATAKVLGIIAILVPGFPRLKEWAYAGFAFDLIGATYSTYAVGEPASHWGFMFIFIALLAGSYYFYHQKLKEAALKSAA
jgi:uncharacterized membrane protein YphA (DoxX/SURF4 family)